MKENQEQISNSISETLKQVKEIVNTSTIVGNEIKTNSGVSIIPISKVVVGYIGGGGEYFDIKVKKTDKPFASGCGTGAYIMPIGFIIIQENGSVKYVEADKELNLQSVMQYFDKIINTLKGGE